MFFPRKRALIAPLCCLLLLLPLPSFSHPHISIDIHITARLNSSGEITALQQHWTFDPFFSALWTQHSSDAQSLIIAALQAENFYAQPKSAFQAAEHIQLYAENDSLQLEFTLPLSQAQKTLRYQIYDPNYYLDITHDRKQAQASPCTWRKLPTEKTAPPLPAEPIDLSLANNIAALAQGITAPPLVAEDIGQYFAETAEFSCP